MSFGGGSKVPKTDWVHVQQILRGRNGDASIADIHRDNVGRGLGPDRGLRFLVDVISHRRQGDSMCSDMDNRCGAHGSSGW